MNLAFTEEQAAIAEAADSLLGKELPAARRRELAGDPAGDGVDAETWRRCAELGWLALGLPEAAGGLGLGLPEEAILFRELGRHLAPGPYLSSILGARVAWHAGSEALTRDIAGGERRVGLAVDGIAVDVRAGDLLLTVDTDGGALFEVGRVEPVPGVDPATRFSRVGTGAPIARAVAPDLLSRARVLVAAEQLGIIEAVRDMSAAYAQTRVQFGQPIGKFQAVKHRCADMAIAAYAIVGEVFQAALLVEAQAPQADFHAACAYVLASRAARRSTADNIQNHGGIGFTWEADPHLYLKRALVLEHILGSPRDALRAVLQPARHEF